MQAISDLLGQLIVISSMKLPTTLLLDANNWDEAVRTHRYIHIHDIHIHDIYMYMIYISA